MNRNYFILTMLLSAFCVLTFSCKDDDIEADNSKNNSSGIDLSDVKVTIGQTEIMTIDQAIEWVFGPEGANADEDWVEARANVRKNAIRMQDSLANVTGENGLLLLYAKVPIYYTTVDELGRPIKLSALMAYKLKSDLSGKSNPTPIDQENIFLNCPYTHTLESECATASEGGWELATFFQPGLFISPDGQGFGVNCNTDQPYLNHKLQAQQIYDALRAGFKTYTEEVGGKMADDWKLRVIGMSQGAGDAMAVHKLLDTTNGTDGKPLRETWRFEYSYVACGPYNPATTVNEYIKEGKSFFPCCLPVTIKSMRLSYPDVLGKYDEKRFYSDKYNEKFDEYSRIITNKELYSGDLNNLLYNDIIGHATKYWDIKRACYMEYMPLDQIFSAELLDPESDIQRDLIKCLQDQDLTSGWTPVTHSYIIWNDMDEVVPSINSKLIIQLFGDKASVKQDKLPTHKHTDTCMGLILSKW